MHIKDKKLAGLAAVAALVSFGSVSALADGPEAVATAARHAGLAAGSDAINAVHMHLHHTLNCLVGADGEGFDGAAGNPCQASGAAIPQTAAGEMHDKLMAVAGEVRGAIANGDLASAKEAAMSVQKMLSGD